MAALPQPETPPIDKSTLEKYSWASTYPWMRELIASDLALEKNPPWQPTAARRMPYTQGKVMEARDKLSEHYTINLKLLTAARLAQGMNVELEHGRRFGAVTNITDNDAVMTARIALAHFREDLFYYDRLARMEKEGAEFWGAHGGTPTLWPDRDFFRA